MSKLDIAVIGAGGHTRSFLNLIDSSNYNTIGVFDDSYKSGEDEYINGVEVKGVISYIPEDVSVALSIGNNKLRKELFQKFEDRLIEDNFIHRTSFISQYTSLGKANQIFAFAYINSGSSIGNNNIINSRCTIEHEVIVGDHNHLSIGSIICGRSKVGNSCFIGAGVVIIDSVSICDNVVIGANSVVISNISQPGTYVGNPIRRIK